MTLIERLYQAGDKASSHQTKHDLQHALEVLAASSKIVSIIAKRQSHKFTAWETDVIIPLGAFLHDVGRSIDVDNHAVAGAKWAKDYLERLTLDNDTQRLPAEVIARVCNVIACHRSSTVLNTEFTDAAWAVVVIADKCVGDEERVRPWRARILAVLTIFRLAWIPLRKGGVHDQVNFAIKAVSLVGQENKLLLKLKLDKRVCTPALVYQTYRDRFAACGKAAAYLGCDFVLDINGIKFGEGLGDPCAT